MEQKKTSFSLNKLKIKIVYVQNRAIFNLVLVEAVR